MRCNQLFQATVFSVLVSLPSTLAAPNQPCPLLNAYYPAPSNLTLSSHIASAVESSEKQLLQAFKNGSSFGLLDANTTAFSVELYSLHNDQPLFTYHHTPELLSSQHTSGVSTVDSNSVYRIGSVSKLWTVFIYLIAAGDSSWNQPITKFVPELADIAQKRPASDDGINNVSWETITVGALASQMAGISRDAAYSGALAAGLESLGLRDQGGSSHSTCGDAARSMLPCNRTAFFADFPTQHPVTLSFNTPVYSNAAYQILSYALENITGSSMEQLFADSLVKPLSLNGTYYNTPATTDSSMIPINSTISWWDGNTEDETPAGGYYSTLNDMRAVGRAMLNSTLLDAATTRSWMQPKAFTSNPDIAVGAPWEIIRAPGSPVSWMYTKSGNLGMYASLVGLLPDLGLGFTVLAAGEHPTTQVSTVASIVTANFVPAMWDQAKDETEATYEGTYTDETTNSTLAVAVASDNSGLIVEQFSLGGEDVIALLGSMLGSQLTIRLYPMGLSAAGSNGTTRVSWRAIFTPSSKSAQTPFNTCTSWGTVNQYIYGGVGLDEFVFVLDASQGNAISLESSVVGVSQSKVKTATGGVSMIKC
ncbi:beta-lactamase/transpeptidase-like protein [Truncatella angustata]|uniref:Beta-lactamase/transpeptidase-like protein n=1 Tax=Truncatella angustata TaxID=152316 RepID=A0A9P8RKS3_9PEZI|nr:beta-lactamase/transpeptidase-like protein [Truncatella angustata]KAH6645115.1 beta-lactamase/transpeptidase-like protein [Truncatella angustata]